MKRFIIILVALATVSKTFASYGSYGSDDAAIIFGVSAISGILTIILFFKVWGMCNNVSKLKERYYDGLDFKSEEEAAKYLRKCIILGDKEAAKRCLLERFMLKIEHAISVMKFNGEVEMKDGELKWKSPELQKVKDFVNPYVKALESQLSMFDEKLPENISKLVTFEDYLNIYPIKNIMVK